MQTANT